MLFQSVKVDFVDHFLHILFTSKKHKHELGIYDFVNKRIVFAPRFDFVCFEDDGSFTADYNDPEIGRIVCGIFDRDGHKRFSSEYSSIYFYEDRIETVIRDDDRERRGVIDRDGNVILPCVWDAGWNGISCKKRRIIFREDGKQGVADFDGNIIVEPIYRDIHWLDDPLLTFKIGDENRGTKGLMTHDGVEVLPAKFDYIFWCDDGYFICRDERGSMMYRWERKA